MDLVSIELAPNGKGLFSARNIRAGEVILRLSGSRMTYREILRLPNPDNAFQVGRNRYIDLREPAVFSNHSCRPNAGVTPKLELKAIRPIKRGQEICFDYSTSMDKETECDFICKCKKRGCRKIIRGFATLPNSLKKAYLELGIVQKFLTLES